MAMRAVAQHITLRGQLVVIARLAIALRLLERENVGGGVDADHDLVVDEPLQLTELVVARSFEDPALTHRPPRNLQRSKAQDEAPTLAPHVALDAALAA